jgi:hypothetical protein
MAGVVGLLTPRPRRQRCLDERLSVWRLDRLVRRKQLERRRTERRCREGIALSVAA